MAIQNTIKSFEPVAAPDALILILGSMPGAESLRKNEYYAYKRNQFWQIMFLIFDRVPVQEYDEKISFIKEMKIALWDVFMYCIRRGSLDSAIEKAAVNDFKNFFHMHPGVRHIFCNGKTAYYSFTKNYSGITEKIPCTCLPSTSPANTISLKEKIKKWKSVRNILDIS